MTTEDVERARREGATDLEIHDTVLIAAAFCMYNRYVDGLATFTPTNPELYDEMGKSMACEGYLAAGTGAPRSRISARVQMRAALTAVSIL